MRRSSVSFVATLTLCAGACTPLRPRVSLQPGVSLKSYRLVAVGPVEDRSGASFNYDVADTVRALLREALRRNGVLARNTSDSTIDTTVPVLYLVSSLDEFRGGRISAALLSVAVGSPKCVLSSRLIDGASGQQLGEIVSTDLVDQSETPIVTPRQLLLTCARMTADEVKRRLQ
jgi:hypothetical protein